MPEIGRRKNRETTRDPSEEASIKRQAITSYVSPPLTDKEGFLGCKPLGGHGMIRIYESFPISYLFFMERDGSGRRLLARAERKGG